MTYVTTSTYSELKNLDQLKKLLNSLKDLQGINELHVEIVCFLTLYVFTLVKPEVLIYLRTSCYELTSKTLTFHLPKGKQKFVVYPVANHSLNLLENIRAKLNVENGGIFFPHLHALSKASRLNKIRGLLSSVSTGTLELADFELFCYDYVSLKSRFKLSFIKMVINAEVGPELDFLDRLSVLEWWNSKLISAY
jgi:hypothetical protein